MPHSPTLDSTNGGCELLQPRCRKAARTVRGKKKTRREVKGSVEDNKLMEKYHELCPHHRRRREVVSLNFTPTRFSFVM